MRLLTARLDIKIQFFFLKKSQDAYVIAESAEIKIQDLTLVVFDTHTQTAIKKIYKLVNMKYASLMCNMSR